MDKSRGKLSLLVDILQHQLIYIYIYIQVQLDERVPNIIFVLGKHNINVFAVGFDHFIASY